MVCVRNAIPQLLFATALVHCTNSIRIRRDTESGLRSSPFDCYSGNGADYEGLVNTGGSGRDCKKWTAVKDSPYGPSVTGIGNHNYCRNPSGEKEKPWCYTVDPTTEWEFCEVRQCVAADEAPEPWTAPAGSKSAGAEQAGPCEHVAAKKPGFEEHEIGRACMDNRGSTWWLITNKRVVAPDAAACKAKCVELPGAKYFTYFSGASGDNCGCYRECVLLDQDVTVDNPTVYKLD